MTTPPINWGSDAATSMPKPMDTPDVEMIDMEGFCFTPDGLRINITHVEYETILTEGFAPQTDPGPR